MKKKLIPAVLAAVIALSATTAYADEKNPELGVLYRYIGDTYDVEIIDPDITGAYIDSSEMWECRRCDDGDGVYLRCPKGKFDYSKDRIKVPDSYNGVAVKRIDGSCVFKEFDLNPKNKYMKLIDNVVFSKDGKTLMSYAQYDERTSYEIPDGTKYVSKNAFYYCDNLKVLKMADSVEEISPMAIASLDNIKEIYLSPNVSVISKSALCCNRTLNLVYFPNNSKITKIDHDAFRYTELKELKLPSFEIEISNSAFIDTKNKVKLKSYIQPEVKATKKSNSSYKLSWDKITNAYYYKIYEKTSDKKYKLVKKTKSNSCTIVDLKNGEKCTYAVKAIGKVNSFKDDYYDESYNLPEYYIIEGTRSEDVTVCG